MNQEEVILNTIQFVKETLKQAEAGHDWFHIERVWSSSKMLSEGQQVNHFVIELAALLHDIADYKFHDGDELIGGETARIFLQSQHILKEDIQHVSNIIDNISFKGGQEQKSFSSLELDIVQDADRLDALGAIGIARTFSYGGHKGVAIHDPAQQPRDQISKKEYIKTTATSINHFYEKLLKLEFLMNTKKGKEIAHARTEYMRGFLKQFYSEWNDLSDFDIA